MTCALCQMDPNEARQAKTEIERLSEEVDQYRAIVTNSEARLLARIERLRTALKRLIEPSGKHECFFASPHLIEQARDALVLEEENELHREG